MKQTEPDSTHELKERLKFEELLARISARFINLPSDRLDEEIEGAQERICDCLGMDLATLFQWTDDLPPSLLLTHLHTPPDGPVRPERLDAREAFPWVSERALNGETFSILTEAMPEGTRRDQESRRYFGVKSSMVVPLSAGGKPPIGIMSFDDIRTARTWPEEIVKRLMMIAQVFTNALERKRIDEAMRQSEARLNLAADSAGAGLWELDFKTDRFWATDRARKIFGYGRDDSISLERFEGSIFPDDLENVRQAIARSANDHEPVNIEYRIRLDSGSFRWITSRGRPFFKPTGEPDRLMGVSVDISERKQMETDLTDRLKEIEKLKHRLENENLYLRNELRGGKGFDKIVGGSKALKSVMAAARQVSTTDATVLILGETGTGKGLVANAIHQMSVRKDRPLVTLNCAALPQNLIESELFGREKGAFTGAHERQVGRFELADNGTIFLDEIGEMPLALQSKLLRVLQEGEFERLGSSRTNRVNVRVIAATGRDLKKEVSEKRFRADLFYRLNVFPISIPPLRNRVEDIPLLAQHFTEKFAAKMDKRIERIPKAAMTELVEYNWPGNVRELEHVIERGVIITSGKSLQLAGQLESSPPVYPQNDHLKDLRTVEQEHILRVLQETEWKIEGPSGAASILKLHPSTLRFRIKKLGIHRPV